MLGISAAGVRLHWDEGFKAFLREGRGGRSGPGIRFSTTEACSSAAVLNAPKYLRG